MTAITADYVKKEFAYACLASVATPAKKRLVLIHARITEYAKTAYANANLGLKAQIVLKDSARIIVLTTETVSIINVFAKMASKALIAPLGNAPAIAIITVFVVQEFATVK